MYVVDTVKIYFDAKCWRLVIHLLLINDDTKHLQATRLNWYRSTAEWKPFHHDAAAMKPEMAEKQNFTVAVSFGVERDAAFEHAKTKVKYLFSVHLSSLKLVFWFCGATFSYADNVVLLKLLQIKFGFDKSTAVLRIRIRIRLDPRSAFGMWIRIQEV
jgi:glutathione S-transferase